MKLCHHYHCNILHVLSMVFYTIVTYYMSRVWCFIPSLHITCLEYGISGCLQLLEILEISWNLIGPPGNFCVICWRSTALVSSHKTGYLIVYLRNRSFYFIFATAPCCIKCISYFCTVHYIGGRSKANMSFKIPPGISWKFAWLNL